MFSVTHALISCAPGQKRRCHCSPRSSAPSTHPNLRCPHVQTCCISPHSACYVCVRVCASLTRHAQTIITESAADFVLYGTGRRHAKRSASALCASHCNTPLVTPLISILPCAPLTRTDGALSMTCWLRLARRFDLVSVLMRRGAEPTDSLRIFAGP